MGISNEIYSIAQTYLRKVRPSGPENVMAICPFHVKADGSPEQHPSFAMSLVNGLWFCHACQEKGNLYTFLTGVGLTREQIDLHHSLTIEGARKNLPEAFDPAQPKVYTDSPIPESLLGVFDYCPLELLRDGFTEQTLQRFEVGFDMTHYRVTYPIRDLTGKLMAISGRTVVNSWPKYKIYDKEFPCWGIPAREMWDKKGALWNAHRVYPELFFQSQPETLVVVEGFKACMWVWQAGIKNVVALLGTYLSNEQRWIIERMGAPVYLFLDNNWPGIKGTRKCAEQLKNSTRLLVIEYPDRLRDDEEAQPDNLTPEEIWEQKSKAVNYFDWKTAA